jgi:hypothetical protein
MISWAAFFLLLGLEVVQCPRPRRLEPPVLLPHSISCMTATAARCSASTASSKAGTTPPRRIRFTHTPDAGLGFRKAAGMKPWQSGPAGYPRCQENLAMNLASSLLHLHKSTIWHLAVAGTRRVCRSFSATFTWPSPSAHRAAPWPSHVRRPSIQSSRNSFTPRCPLGPSRITPSC